MSQQQNDKVVLCDICSHPVYAGYCDYCALDVPIPIPLLIDSEEDKS